MNWLTREITDDDIGNLLTGHRFGHIVATGTGLVMLAVGWVLLITGQSVIGVSTLVCGGFAYTMGRTWP